MPSETKHGHSILQNSDPQNDLHFKQTPEYLMILKIKNLPYEDS